MSYNLETGLYEGYIYKIWNDVNDKLYIGQTTTTLKERWHGHMSAALDEKRSVSLLYRAMRKYGREKFHIEEVKKIICSSKDELIEKLNIDEQYYIFKYKSLSSENGYNFEKGGNNKKVPGRIVYQYDKDLNLVATYESCCEAGRKTGIPYATIYNVASHHQYQTRGYYFVFDGDDVIVPDYDQIRKETARKASITRRKNSKKKKNKQIKDKKPYKSRAMQLEEKRKRRLDRLGWNGEKIILYNAYGEVICIFEDMVEAIELIPIDSCELKKNLSFQNSHFHDYVIRYESVPFDAHPNKLSPVCIYDLNGNFVKRFPKESSAERYLNISNGEIRKVLNRGGSTKGYLVSEYGKPIIRLLNRIFVQIEMMDDNGNVIKVFDNKKEVSNYFNVKDLHSSLNKAIESGSKYKGYYWRVKEEYKLAS